MSADESTDHKKKKKNNIQLSQSSPPSSLNGTGDEKHAVWCAQQASTNSSESLLNKPKLFLSLSSVCADEGSKARMLKKHIRKKNKKQRGSMTISCGIFPVLVGRECPMLDVQKQRCLISHSRPSLRQCSGQVGCKEPSGSLLWWKASGCHTNLIGWCLIGALWLDGALVNCNQSWSVRLVYVHISE